MQRVTQLVTGKWHSWDVSALKLFILDPDLADFGKKLSLSFCFKSCNFVSKSWQLCFIIGLIIQYASKVGEFRLKSESVLTLKSWLLFYLKEALNSQLQEICFEIEEIWP